MVVRRVVSVTGNPIGSLYSELLSSLVGYANLIGFVYNRKTRDLKPSATIVLDALEAFLVDISEIGSWPGTEMLPPRTAQRWLFNFNDDSVAILLNHSTNLYAWVNPKMPEDLHLIRSDGHTVLGSIAQHSDAWIELAQDDYEQWWAGLSPQLREILTPGRW